MNASQQKALAVVRKAFAALAPEALTQDRSGVEASAIDSARNAFDVDAELRLVRLWSTLHDVKDPLAGRTVSYLLQRTIPSTQDYPELIALELIAAESSYDDVSTQLNLLTTVNAWIEAGCLTSSALLRASKKKNKRF